MTNYIVNTYPNRGVTFVGGRGIYLESTDGQKYLDLMSNYGVNVFGYNHPEINQALIDQIQKLTTLHGSFNSDVRVLASEILIKMCGKNYSQVYWSNSGAEAIEAALKFAVLTTGKKRFIVCQNGYHGKTLGALSATSGEKYKKPFEPLLWEFVHIPFNHPKALETAIDAEGTAGFIVEPIQGEGGVYVPEIDYLKKVEEICRQKGIILIIDEIQTGVGRTGKFLASQGIDGDILCLGKGLGGGIPIGTTIINTKVYQTIPKGIHTSTFGGNPLACAGVIVTLNLLNDESLHYIKTIGEYFLNNLSELKSPLITNIRGIGLMIGIEINNGQRNQILKLLQQEKILAIPAGENVVRFLPPYIITKKHIDFVIEKLRVHLRGVHSATSEVAGRAGARTMTPPR